MQTLLYAHFDKLVLFAMVLARIGAMVLSAPVFGSRAVPLHFALLAISLAMIVSPLLWHSSIPMPAGVLPFCGNLIIESLIGLSLGIAILLLFSGIEVAGRLIAQSTGGVMTDPSPGEPDEGSPAPTRLLQILALAIFVAMGGHRLLMSAMLESFQALPPASGELPVTVLSTVTLLVGASLQLAARTAAPTVAALLAATLLVGLAARALPQLNAFTVGFAVNIWTTLVALLFSLGAIAFLFQEQTESFLAIWQRAL